MEKAELNKKLFIPAGVCLLIRLWTIIDFVLFVGLKGDGAAKFFLLCLEMAAFLCVFGAFAFDSLGKRGAAAACAAACIADSFVRHVLINLLMPVALLGESIDITGFFQTVYILPCVFLLIFVLNRKRTRGSWLVLGIIFMVFSVCDGYTLPLHGLMYRYSLRQIGTFSAIISLFTGALHGLVYLFGFMQPAHAQR